MTVLAVKMAKKHCFGAISAPRWALLTISSVCITNSRTLHHFQCLFCKKFNNITLKNPIPSPKMTVLAVKMAKKPCFGAISAPIWALWAISSVCITNPHTLHQFQCLVDNELNNITLKHSDSESENGRFGGKMAVKWPKALFWGYLGPQMSFMDDIKCFYNKFTCSLSIAMLVWNSIISRSKMQFQVRKWLFWQ